MNSVVNFDNASTPSHPSSVGYGEKPTDKKEQGKCLCERWLSVKAGTGRRLELTSEGKDFPKPLCKTTADPAADSGT